MTKTASPDTTAPKSARATEPRPAYRKFTEHVRGGLRYALESLEFDLEHGPTCEVALPITDKQLTAAAEWIRYKLATERTDAPESAASTAATDEASS